MARRRLCTSKLRARRRSPPSGLGEKAMLVLGMVCPRCPARLVGYAVLVERATREQSRAVEDGNVIRIAFNLRTRRRVRSSSPVHVLPHRRDSRCPCAVRALPPSRAIVVARSTRRRDAPTLHAPDLPTYLPTHARPW